MSVLEIVGVLSLCVTGMYLTYRIGAFLVKAVRVVNRYEDQLKTVEDRLYSHDYRISQTGYDIERMGREKKDKSKKELDKFLSRGNK